MKHHRAPALEAADSGPVLSKTKSMKPLIDVTIETQRNAHIYHAKMNGNEHGPFKSVTHYLKIIDKSGPLMHWAAKVALANVRQELLIAGGPEPKLLEHDFINDIIKRAAERPLKEFEKAGDFGTRAHVYFDRIINNLPFAISSEDEILIPAINGLEKFLKETHIQIVQGDTKVVSIKFQYGGSFDAIALRGNDYGIIDFKTSNGCYPEMALQVAAYVQATRETFGIDPKWGMILRFGKTKPEYEARELADLRGSFSAFVAAKRLTECLKSEHFKGAT